MFEQIVEMISKQLKAEPGKIFPETRIAEDLGADSLDIVELLMEIEDEFGVKVPDEDIQDLRTVKDIADYVESRRDI